VETAEIGPDAAIWCVGGSADVYQWNNAWLDEGGNGTNSIAVASAAGVYAANGGKLYTWNGSGWTQITTGFTVSISAVDAISAIGGTSLSALDSSGGVHVSSDAAILGPRSRARQSGSLVEVSKLSFASPRAPPST
jgi:hypothetical protein